MSGPLLPQGVGHVRVGKLNLVDLAGSERQGKAQTSGERFREAIKINLSLSALSGVISALTDRNAGTVLLATPTLGGQILIRSIASWQHILCMKFASLNAAEQSMPVMPSAQRQWGDAQVMSHIETAS